MTGQALNSRGPEGRAAAGGAYDDLGVELRTAGGTPALPHGFEYFSFPPVAPVVKESMRCATESRAPASKSA